ncbi:hypothetical protein FOCC_FOCC017878 [Frankliniella occidentalis]|nr:hypothetical protein FOCC_FOCC017878 [Frankliniella occidentalis]
MTIFFNSERDLICKGAFEGRCMCLTSPFPSLSAMDRAASQGHVVDCCIVVEHLGRLSASMDQDRSNGTNGATNGTNGTNGAANGATNGSSGRKRVSMKEDRDFWWTEEMEDASSSCYPVWVNAEDPLFMLYTSGSTGKPKGVLHTTGGYLMYAATTFKYVFDYKPNDVYWCTADVGWITGHTYVFEGTPFYPDNDRYWSVIDKYKVSQFYTAPTAIRSLMKFGDEPVLKHNLSTLKVLGSVGEPINPEAWLWYYKMIGKGECSIVDTFWQTETGGHVLTPLPGCTPMKPGSATFPFFGVQPQLLDENGKRIDGPGEGYLVFGRPWPGMMRTLYGNHERFEQDGFLWVTGRVDDMLNVSGHLMSTAEVESVLVEHASVAEAAVVSRPHPVKGECLYCFITPNEGAAVLRKVAVNDRDVGDISTLADESVVEQLFANRPAEAQRAPVHSSCGK